MVWAAVTGKKLLVHLCSNYWFVCTVAAKDVGFARGALVGR